MKLCSYCKERAIAAFYIGDGRYVLTCPDHFPEAEKQYPLNSPIILDSEAEKMLDTGNVRILVLR